jgi:hypothetical protein
VAGEPDIVEKLKAAHQVGEFVALRVPKLFNPPHRPFERADITSNTHYDWLLDWLLDHAILALAAAGGGQPVPRDLRGVPPRQKAASFTIGPAAVGLVWQPALPWASASAAWW